MADIEKENLEAHVELCAERYRALHDKLDTVGSRLDVQDKKLNHISDSLQKIERSRNQQVMSWSNAIIAGLCAAVGALVLYVFKTIA